MRSWRHQHENSIENHETETNNYSTDYKPGRHGHRLTCVTDLLYGNKGEDPHPRVFLTQTVLIIKEDTYAIHPNWGLGSAIPPSPAFVKKRLEYAENKEYERSKEGKETISSGGYKVAL